MLLVDVVDRLVKKGRFTCISSGTHLLTFCKVQTLFNIVSKKKLLSFPSKTVGSLSCCRIQSNLLPLSSEYKFLTHLLLHSKQGGSRTQRHISGLS